MAATIRLTPTPGRTRAGLAVVCLLVAATSQVGQGLWILGKAVVAQHLLRRAWARTLAGERSVKPWPWADTWPTARLMVPRLGIDLIVLSNASGRTLAFGPAWYPAASQADGQDQIILTGHRDTHFRFLQHLRPGDLLSLLDARGTSQSSRVIRLSVVDSRRGVPVSEDPEGRLTLVTCYPFDTVVPGGPMRYLVEAEMVALPFPATVEPAPVELKPPLRHGPVDRGCRDGNRFNRTD